MPANGREQSLEGRVLAERTGHMNGIIERLRRGELALGAWVEVGDYRGAREAGDSSADFAILDMEHVGFSFPDLGQTLQWMLSRRNAGSVPAAASPIVRIPPNGAEPNQWMVKQSLDYGAFGILHPQVTTAQQAATIAAAMRYPGSTGHPGLEGVRGTLPMTAMRYWGIPDYRHYFDRADLWPLRPDGDLLLGVLVESVAAWQNIDEIVAAPGLGAVFWGPGDGSMSLGLRDFDIADERLAPYRAKVIAACKAAGVAVGTPGAIDPFAAVDEGFDFLVLTKWDEDLARQLREYSLSRAQA